MLQAIYKESPYVFDVSTEDVRFDTAIVPSKINDQIRYLFKFVNDMSGAIHYGYGQSQDVSNRYTQVSFTHNTTGDIYTGAMNFLPNGSWTYSVYEVTWQGTATLTGATAPGSETDVLPIDPANGIVQGLANSGKLYVREEEGEEQVQYTEYTSATVRSFIINYVGAGYTSAPTVTISGGGGTGATATASVSGGVLTKVTLTAGGSGYTSAPDVVLTGGGGTTQAEVLASLQEANYIYYGQ